MPEKLYQRDQTSKKTLGNNLDLIPELAAGASLASSTGVKSVSFIATMSTPGTKKANNVSKQSMIVEESKPVPAAIL